MKIKRLPRFETGDEVMIQFGQQNLWPVEWRRARVDAESRASTYRVWVEVNAALSAWTPTTVRAVEMRRGWPPPQFTLCAWEMAQQRKEAHGQEVQSRVAGVRMHRQRT